VSIGFYSVCCFLPKPSIRRKPLFGGCLWAVSNTFAKKGIRKKAIEKEGVAARMELLGESDHLQQEATAIDLLSLETKKVAATSQVA
jgi:hypothetical protein